MPLNANAITGMFEPRFFQGTTPKNKATGITVNRGDICNIDTGTAPDSYRTCPTSGIGPYVWCEQTVLAASAKAKFSAVDYPCEVYVRCDGVIEVGSVVQTSATNAGRVMASAGTLATNTRRVGIYLRKPGQGDDASPITAAADGDVIIIWFEPFASSPAA